MTAIAPDAALAQLSAKADPQKAADMARYHKAQRRYLGVANPAIDRLAKAWRKDLSVDARVALAAALWGTDIHEAHIAAAKILDQPRIRPDAAIWDLIVSWIPDFDAWAIADHASIAGQKRLVADPARLDTVATWTRSDHMWTRRAALVMTLPWTRQKDPTAEDEAVRDCILEWAAGYLDDDDWFIHKAVAWWLRDLSKRDPARVRKFLAANSDRMRPFARRIAKTYIDGAP